VLSLSEDKSSFLKVAAICLVSTFDCFMWQVNCCWQFLAFMQVSVTKSTYLSTIQPTAIEIFNGISCAFASVSLVVAGSFQVPMIAMRFRRQPPTEALWSLDPQMCLLVSLGPSRGDNLSKQADCVAPCCVLPCSVVVILRVFVFVLLLFVLLAGVYDMRFVLCYPVSSNLVRMYIVRCIQYRVYSQYVDI